MRINAPRVAIITAFMKGMATIGIRGRDKCVFLCLYPGFLLYARIGLGINSSCSKERFGRYLARNQMAPRKQREKKSRRDPK